MRTMRSSWRKTNSPDAAAARRNGGRGRDCGKGERKGRQGAIDAKKELEEQSRELQSVEDELSAQTDQADLAERERDAAAQQLRPKQRP